MVLAIKATSTQRPPVVDDVSWTIRNVKSTTHSKAPLYEAHLPSETVYSCPLGWPPYTIPCMYKHVPTSSLVALKTIVVQGNDIVQGPGCYVSIGLEMYVKYASNCTPTVCMYEHAINTCRISCTFPTMYCGCVHMYLRTYLQY